MQDLSFSVSRLPKWARSKVTIHSPPMHIDSTPFKVGVQQDCLFLGSQSHILKVSQKNSGTLSETDSSQVTPETYRWALNNRWLTIHTVCMDSPETCDRKGLNVLGSETDSRSQGEVMETIHSSRCIKLSSLDPNFRDCEHVNIQDAPPLRITNACITLVPQIMVLVLAAIQRILKKMTCVK